MPFFDFFRKSGKKRAEEADDVSHSLDRLALTEQVFVGDKLNRSGGKYSRQDVRKPAYPANRKRPSTGPTVFPPAPPRAPVMSMPVPQLPSQHHSLTMQHALYSNSNPDRHSLPVIQRPYSDGIIPPYTIPIEVHVHVNNNTLTVPSKWAAHDRPTPSSLPATPQSKLAPTSDLSKLTLPKERRPRASSTPTSPVTASFDSPVTQCAGVTKAGKRCTRQVKSGPPLAVVHPDVPLERFCFQHTKDVMDPSGFYSRKNPSEWVEFKDYIKDYLQPDTQVALRTEMEKPRSVSDVPGYIYTFEIRDLSNPSYVHLKVGRAVNLVKRLDQWDKQCGSKEKEHVLRGWWPSENEESLMKGRIVAGKKGECCHRLERLVHLELADLVLYQPYMNPDFPNTGSSPRTGTPGANANKKRKCPDCGTTHKEIFSFKRVESGPYKDKEWELIVEPVIRKWGRFVEEHL